MKPLTPRQRSVDSYVRLVYRDKPYGPGFPSKEAAAAFVRWVEARTGLEWSQQSATTLGRLQAEWEREKAA